MEFIDKAALRSAAHVAIFHLPPLPRTAQLLDESTTTTDAESEVESHRTPYPGVRKSSNTTISLGQSENSWSPANPTSGASPAGVSTAAVNTETAEDAPDTTAAARTSKFPDSNLGGTPHKIQITTQDDFDGDLGNGRAPESL